MNVNERVAQYVKLRDYKDKAKKEFDEGMARVTEAMKKIEGEFLAALNDQGVDSLKGPAGTAYKIERNTCSVKDRDEFFKFAIRSKHIEAMDIRANKKVVKELLDEGIDVPGVKFSQSIQIGVRRGTSDE